MSSIPATAAVSGTPPSSPTCLEKAGTVLKVITITPMLISFANEARVEANRCLQRAEDAGAKDNRALNYWECKAKIERASTVGYSFAATGTTILTVVAVSALILLCAPGLFNHHYLNYGAMAGAGFFGAGVLIKIMAHIYQERNLIDINREESEEQVRPQPKEQSPSLLSPTES